MSKPRKPKMGRPPKNAADKHSENIRVTLTPEEKRDVLAACGGTDVSRWAREILVPAARSGQGRGKN